MTRYNVTVFATKVGSAHMNNAVRLVVEVEAENATLARGAAITKVYATRSDLEHVNPRKVEAA